MFLVVYSVFSPLSYEKKKRVPVRIFFCFQSSADPAPDSDNDSSVSGLSNLSGLSGEESWKPVSG